MAKFLSGLAALVVLAGCSTSPVEPTAYQPDFTHGMALYQGQCGSCHDAGKRSAPSIRDAEEWDLQTLSRPGILRQHLAMNLLPVSGATGLTEYDEADVLYYMHHEVSLHED